MGGELRKVTRPRSLAQGHLLKVHAATGFHARKWFFPNAIELRHHSSDANRAFMKPVPCRSSRLAGEDPRPDEAIEGLRGIADALKRCGGAYYSMPANL